MTKQYATFVTQQIGDLQAGKTVRLMVKDLTPGPRKYDSRCVEAVVSASPMADADQLQVRASQGYLYPQPFWIRIVRELGDFPPQAI